MPAQRKIKCNTDGVSRGNPGESAYSFCLRNGRGILIHAEAEPMSNATNMQAKIGAIKEAVTYCKEHKIREVILETDSLVAMKILKTEWEIPWHIEPKTQYIQQVMQEVGIHIQHIFREANQLVDALANEACEQQKKISMQI